MKKKWIVSTLGIFGLLILICLGTFKYLRETPFSPKAFAKKDRSYFNPIFITKWTAGECPCLPIQIGDKVISSHLDLGFKGYFSINSSTLDQIEEKTLLGSQIMYGFQGHQYKKNVFKIPEIQISGKPFYSIEVQEEAKDFYANGSLVKDGVEPSPGESGSIGWKIFQNTNLLLDLRNKKIAFCDSLSTLKKQGYSVESFEKTPLIIERGLIEIDAKTADGYLRCVLDTGCTCNLLNTKNDQGKSMGELVWNSENYYETPLFQINGMEFGATTFRRIPIQIPIHIEAILGMDFLSENIVFLDFSNNLAYFSH